MSCSACIVEVSYACDSFMQDGHRQKYHLHATNSREMSDAWTVETKGRASVHERQS